MKAPNYTAGWECEHASLSTGQSSCGLDLRVHLGRPLTDVDKGLVSRAMRDLERALLAESARLHPDNIAWKDEWLTKARAVFDEAGLAPIYVREIPNEYCGPECCPHRAWLIVTTRRGPIKIGWRKNVINIDWSDADIYLPAEHVTSDKVTKGVAFIHAWGYEKATEYLRALGASR